jgi:8-oxo-dGTP pyrophosphatase MutT (NUDIX family)
MQNTITMTDILFRTDEYVFSYRVAGILIHNGKVLLQSVPDEPGFAFPGGHAELGETNAQTLRREFLEEINADITVGDLKWLGEIFWPWGDKPCHQICLFYEISLIDDTQIPADGKFTAFETIEGRSFQVEYRWIPLGQIDELLIYPTQAIDLLKKPDSGFRHFIYRESEKGEVL